MSEPKQIIHIRIRDLRRQHALTQEELAAALGISRQSINAMEAGRCLPSLPVALQIASYFSVPLTAVFDFPETRQQERGSQSSTALIPWNPIQDAIDELLEESVHQPVVRGVVPAMNLYQTAREIVAEFYIPGFSKEHLDTEVGEDFIRVTGLAERININYLHQEISRSSFERTVHLPVAVRHLEAKAELRNGVLTIVVPKAINESSRSAHISISSAE